jgi:hypothetical protein
MAAERYGIASCHGAGDLPLWRYCSAPMRPHVGGRLSHNVMRPARGLQRGGSGQDGRRKRGEDKYGQNSSIHGIASITSRGFNEPIADMAFRERNLRQLATEPLVAAF